MKLSRTEQLDYLLTADATYTQSLLDLLVTDPLLELDFDIDIAHQLLTDLNIMDCVKYIPLVKALIHSTVGCARYINHRTKCLKNARTPKTALSKARSTYDLTAQSSPTLESVIMLNSWTANRYAIEILQHRWFEAEPIISKNAHLFKIYCKHFNINEIN
jgi:hypothetical protein